MILDSVLEAYFGENPKTDRIVSIFSKMAKVKISSDKKLTIKLVNDLRDAFKDFTNANRVEVEIDDMGSCFTIPPQYEKIPDYTITKSGLQFAKNNQVYICINVNPKWIFKGTTRDKMNLTPRELTAILLHEVGHNFSHSIVPIHDLLETIKLAIYVRNTETIYSSNNKDMQLPEDIISKLKTNILNILNDTKIIGAGLLTIGATVNRERYIDEVIADSFATIFGFGKDLSSGLKKINDYYLNPLNKSMGYFSGTMISALSMAFNILFDEHPNDITRMTNQINILEHELENNKGISKEDKKKIKKDILGIKTVIKQYNTINKSDKFTLPMKLYSNFLITIMGGEEIFTKITSSLYNPRILNNKVGNLKQ